MDFRPSKKPQTLATRTFTLNRLINFDNYSVIWVYKNLSITYSFQLYYINFIWTTDQRIFYIVSSSLLNNFLPFFQHKAENKNMHRILKRNVRNSENLNWIRKFTYRYRTSITVSVKVWSNRNNLRILSKFLEWKLTHISHHVKCTYIELLEEKFYENSHSFRYVYVGEIDAHYIIKRL